MTSGKNKGNLNLHRTYAEVLHKLVLKVRENHLGKIPTQSDSPHQPEEQSQR
jgi:hypothetical protein